MTQEQATIIGAVELPAGTVSGLVDVLRRYRDGYGREVVDVGKNGKRLVCGLDARRLKAGLDSQPAE
jgi:hypothetical protein